MKYFNIIREFKKDFGLTVFNDSKNVSKRVNLRTLMVYCSLLTLYVLSKPFYLVFMANLEKKYRLNKIKEEGKFIM